MLRTRLTAAVLAALLALALGSIDAQTELTGNVRTNHTEAADTTIKVIAPASSSGTTRIRHVKYTAGGTAHTLTILRPIGETTSSADAAASQAVINLTADPGPTSNLLAANDHLVIKNDDGTFIYRKVSSITGLAVTVDSNFAVKVSKGAKVWNFGIVGDTDPVTGFAHPSWPSLLEASKTTTLTGPGAFQGSFLCNGHKKDQPILLHSNNATAAGTFVEVSWVHVP